MVYPLTSQDTAENISALDPLNEGMKARNYFHATRLKLLWLVIQSNSLIYYIKAHQLISNPRSVVIFNINFEYLKKLSRIVLYSDLNTSSWYITLFTMCVIDIGSDKHELL